MKIWKKKKDGQKGLTNSRNVLEGEWMISCLADRWIWALNLRVECNYSCRTCWHTIDFACFLPIKKKNVYNTKVHGLATGKLVWPSCQLPGTAGTAHSDKKNMLQTDLMSRSFRRPLVDMSREPLYQGSSIWLPIDNSVQQTAPCPRGKSLFQSAVLRCGKQEQKSWDHWGGRRFLIKLEKPVDRKP